MAAPEKIYALLPNWGQNAAASLFGFYRQWQRFGPGFEARVKAYRQREQWTADQLIAFQKEQLRTLLAVAADHVPYYRHTWTAEQKDMAREGALLALPLLEKEPIRISPGSFARDDFRPRPRFTYHTSGSSGTPVATYWTLSEVRDSRALREARLTGWAGVSFREPRATFSGRMVITDSRAKGPYHRFNRSENQVYFSAFHLSPGTARQYVDALHEHGTKWLHGYAFSSYLLARHILDQGLNVPLLKAIVTTSEKVTPEMRRVMEAAFRCPVFEEYSTVENAVFVSQCENGVLHFSPDTGILEILRPNGTPCGTGEIGEVVATSFVRKYQPFIRYRLGDLAAWGTEPCSCGRALPVVQEIVGRLEDVIAGPDGREMVRFHGIFVDQPHVVEGQIIQEALDRIRAKVVPAPGFGPTDAENIECRIRQRLGDVRVIVEAVEEIPRTQAGKFKAVVSQVR